MTLATLILSTADSLGLAWLIWLTLRTQDKPAKSDDQCPRSLA